MTDPTELEQAAIAAIEARLRIQHFGIGRYWLQEILAAVPLDYCIQRAINERAFICVGRELHQTDADLLYRLASENETSRWFCDRTGCPGHTDDESCYERADR